MMTNAVGVGIVLVLIILQFADHTFEAVVIASFAIGVSLASLIAPTRGRAIPTDDAHRRLRALGNGVPVGCRFKLR
jgi:hypothetical protein